jgi:hypothetical protein
MTTNLQFSSTLPYTINIPRQNSYILCNLLDNNALLTDDFCYYYQINKPVNLAELFQQLYLAFGLFIIGFVFSMTAYGMFIYPAFEKNQRHNDISSDDEPEHLHEAPYTERYPISKAKQKLNITEDKSPEAIQTNEYNFVAEATPDGFVVMNYNYDEEGFQYWSTKSISFNILETVARKFVTLYHMKDLYIDRNPTTIEPDSESEQEITDNDNNSGYNDVSDTDSEANQSTNTSDEETQVTSETQPVKESPFATFKSYNKTSGNVSQSNNTLNTNSTNQKQSCKFIHKGTLIDIDLLQSDTYNKPLEEQKITFASFKRLFYNSQS